MAGPGQSRWADSENDAAAEALRKQEKDAKKRAKAEKAQKLEEDAAQQRRREEEQKAFAKGGVPSGETGDARAPKRRRLSPEPGQTMIPEINYPKLLRCAAPEWYPSRNVSNFERLNHIEEGSYGWVSRARETATGEVVALKKLKMEGSDSSGFPVTGIREIQCLMEARHKHVVELREVVVGSGLDEVFLVMEFLEHDLKTLQEEMQEPFLPSEIKTLLLQLTDAVGFLHDHWILHVRHFL